MRLSEVFYRAIFATLLAVWTPAAYAAAIQPIDFSNGAFIQTAGPTSVPYGYVEFCHRIPAACTRNVSVEPAVRLTPTLWKQLLFVNSYYNTTIIPMTDMQQYHVADFWAYPDSGYGDCEDYQLAKQRELIRQGWPASDLLMTAVRDKNGDGHAVLVVRTDRGDFVLDNEDSLIRLWSDTPYLYLKRESQSDPTQWVGLIDNHQTIIVAKRGADAEPLGTGAVALK